MYDFSIITPSLNQGKFIEDNLASISNQKGVEIEHIVMDALSTDETQSLLANYRSNHRLIWKSEADKGQTDAINKGMQLADGEILSYLNADDYLYSDGTLSRVKTLMDQTGADILYGDVVTVDASKCHIGEIRGSPFVFDRLMKRNFIPQPATFFRSSVFHQAGFFREDLQYAMDLEYWLRCALKKMKFHYEPEFFACFREHESSKTCSQTKSLISEGYEVVRAEYFGHKPIRLWAYHILAMFKFYLK